MWISSVPRSYGSTMCRSRKNWRWMFSRCRCSPCLDVGGGFPGVGYCVWELSILCCTQMDVCLDALISFLLPLRIWQPSFFMEGALLIAGEFCQGPFLQARNLSLLPKSTCCSACINNLTWRLMVGTKKWKAKWKKNIVIPSCNLRRAGCKLALTVPNSLTRVSCDRVGITNRGGRWEEGI